MRVVAVYRSPSYSPLQHGVNDTAILDATIAHLTDCVESITTTTEHDVEQGYLPAADLYLNMCQGSLAAEQLMPLEADGAVVVNRPSSALSCHRHRLIARLRGAPLAFPRTMVVSSATPPTASQIRRVINGAQRVWIKRGDVHAERPEDVMNVAVAAVPATVAEFRDRGIPWVALQEHVAGPIVKFYAVADGRFFRWYAADAGPGGPRPAVSEDRLKALAMEAATLLGLEVFGGDVAFPQPDRPVLIDLNDWPSFAPFRDEAAAAIAAYVLDRVHQGSAP